MVAPNTVVRGTTNKPVASSALAAFFESEDAPEGGQLFIGYPITTTSDGKRPVDAVYLSPDHGVVVFDIVEGANLGDYADRQDDAANRVELRLKQHKNLMKKRDLLVDVHTITFAPAVKKRSLPTDDEYVVANGDTIAGSVSELTWAGSDADVLKQALSAVQSVSGIRRSPTSRVTVHEDSRGAKLKRLENSIATLDAAQSRAVIETADGVQRIRGLAGSGKTVVLALKAAYLHSQHPEWDIAVTFNTRSLRDQFTRLINTFTIEQAGDEPDWSKLNVLQAWGASGGGNREGLYHRFCVENGVRYFDFNAAKTQFGFQGALGGSCGSALAEVERPRKLYDAILVDEAQDLPKEFLRLCYSSLGPEKRLVYAYDELQTLSGAGLPSAEEIFGTDSDGNPLVDFDVREAEAERDIILEKCYRNSRPLLVTAHALGFGIYRDRPPKATTGLVQIFEQKDLWEDIGYQVRQGALADGEKVSLTRDEETSPKFLEAHSSLDDLIHFQRFDSQDAQAAWLAQEIERNLTTDELLANDIIVINPDPFTTRDNLGLVRGALHGLGIQSHLAGVDVVADVFFKPEANSVTFTGIHRAKGNEAGMVYVANAHESFKTSANLASVRNRLFTAITRSKAWVRVTGVGDDMDALIAEYEKIRRAHFRLDFTYPTEDERATLQILHRDMSKADQKRVRTRRESLSNLVHELESGELYPEDLDPETLGRLRQILAGGNV